MMEGTRNKIQAISCKPQGRNMLIEKIFIVKLYYQLLKTSTPAKGCKQKLHANEIDA